MTVTPAPDRSAAPVGEPILGDADLAARWGKSLHTIRVRRMKGDLPRGFRIGRTWRFYLSEVLAYEQAKMSEQAA
ncbi:helix-turn-helix transcriptional regulator [Rothia endophytica]|uniref:helix-turn-helix transcriptional regulator n=1 Tax=Rothia endophytica TaxID=1324766 RepID=UPI001F3744DE|nr:helix-turn-helix domain-containing protein [Rothia endophytica]